MVGIMGLGVASAVLFPSSQSGTSTPLEDIPSAPQSPPIACEEIGPKLLESLATSLTVQGSGTIRGARAVRSSAHANAYYVAAEIGGPGMKSAVGLWATNSITDPDLLYSVNNMAITFSEWGDGRRTDAAFSASDPGARAALACAG